MFCGLTYDISLKMSHVLLRRVYILMLLGRMFCICLLCPNASLDTDKDCVEYVDHFGWEVIATLTVLAVLIHGCGMSFLSLRSFKMSFNSIYYVQNTSLVLLLLSLFLSTLFCCFYKWYCFLNFIFWLFIASV